jgi:hypothetical protein
MFPTGGILIPYQRKWLVMPPPKPMIVAIKTNFIFLLIRWLVAFHLSSIKK